MNHPSPPGTSRVRSSRCRPAIGRSLALVLVLVLAFAGGIQAADPSAGNAPALPGGVPAGSHWAYQPIRDPEPPDVRNAHWCRTPIDRFILAKLEARGITPAPEADRLTLIRRLSYDLTGLPPTTGEVDRFLADESPDAFARLVDRLLASPAYGERWGRHWLDVVRYADTSGCSSDYPVPSAHRYRDYVIDAFNDDKPFDEFVREQLAGDLLPASDAGDRRAKVVATGYLATARRFGVSGRESHLTIGDILDNLGQAFLGLNLSCARCHDHKHDAVTMRDYYALYGFFESTRLAFPGSENSMAPSDFTPLGTPDQVAEARLRDERLAALGDEHRKLAGIERDLRLNPGGNPPEGTPTREEVRHLLRDIEREQREVLASGPPLELAYAAFDGEPRDARLQDQGEPGRTGPVVRRRFLEILGGAELPANHAGSGRRFLADQLVGPANPLTARVLANRLWQHHFGEGIVRTPNDFGTFGEPPTHPDLLDHLASRLVGDGWSLKSLHRRILLSSAWRMASRHADEERLAAEDPGVRLAWRFRPRRLDAEEIVDSLLAASGTLVRGSPGPHPFPPPEEMLFTQHNPFTADYESHHRAVYWMRQRLRRHPVLALFDAPDTKASTGRRQESTTALQGLFLLNGPFVHEAANALADRLLVEAGDDATRIALAHRLVLARPPSSEEAARSARFLRDSRIALVEAGVGGADVSRRALGSLARVLFATNDFLHVD